MAWSGEKEAVVKGIFVEKGLLLMLMIKKKRTGTRGLLKSAIFVLVSLWVDDKDDKK